MTVVPTIFNGDGSLAIVCSNCSTTSPLAAAEITHAAPGFGGTIAAHVLNLTCPACQSMSSHPIGGGADPAAVQELFVRVVVRLGCACAAALPIGRPVGVVQAHIKLQAEKEGIGRWQAGTLH